MRALRRAGAAALTFGILAGAAVAAAPDLRDLFQKAKLRVAAQDYRGGLEAIAELEAEAAKPGNEAARSALRPAAAFYRGVCLASMGREDEARAEFAVYIAANPDKGIDGNAYSKKVVASFEAAQKSRRSGAEETALSSLAVAYRKTSLRASSGPPAGPDWAEGPARFLLTPEEARQFARMTEGAERNEFVSKFWNAPSADGSPAANREPLRAEFDRRAAFADEYFSDAKRRGSLSDRGMVFLLLGPPSAVIRRPISLANDTPSMLTMNGAANPAPRAPIGLSPSDQPSNWLEIWRYNRELLPAEVPYALVDFSFQTRIDYGENVLQREPAVVRTLEEARRKWRASGP